MDRCVIRSKIVKRNQKDLNLGLQVQVPHRSKMSKE
ncbi:unnamed protein product, partial [Tenebrio molitor]